MHITLISPFLETFMERLRIRVAIYLYIMFESVSADYFRLYFPIHEEMWWIKMDVPSYNTILFSLYQLWYTVCCTIITLHLGISSDYVFITLREEAMKPYILFLTIQAERRYLEMFPRKWAQLHSVNWRGAGSLRLFSRGLLCPQDRMYFEFAYFYKEIL